MRMEDVQQQLHNDTLYASILGIVCIVLLTAGIVLYFSYKRAKTSSANTRNAIDPAHVQRANKQAWRNDIDKIVEQYHQHKLTQDQACAKLAAVARTYVSRMSGENIQTHTLGDITSLRLTWRNKKGADMLRQTIAALYPPEFADYKDNEQARNTSVERAAEWVLVLLEGWQTKGQRV